MDVRPEPFEPPAPIPRTIPPSRLEIIKDSSTLVPIDQPELIARLLRQFVGGIGPVDPVGEEARDQ